MTTLAATDTHARGGMTDRLAEVLAENLPKFDRSVAMLAWGYNEEILIKDFLVRALALLEASCEEYELIFVDDCSTDRTGQIADDMAAQNPRLKIIHNARNLGSGGAANVAVRAVTSDVLFWQTVDWAYDITELKRFLWFTRRYDVVLGVRPLIWRPISHVPVLRSLLGWPRRSDDWLRGFVSLSNYYLLRLMFPVRFYDFQNVHIYPRRLVEQIDIGARSSFISPEMLYRCYLRGATFLEVPIRFLPRQAGEPKGIRPKAILRSLRDIWRGWRVLSGPLWQAVRHNAGRRRVFRLVEAPYMTPEDIRLAAPLFRYHRHPE
jgi:glycosyltransferase involved in cell wall biosynthesis